MIRLILIVVLAIALAVPLAACGKKGSIEAPPKKKSEFPRQYPRP